MSTSIDVTDTMASMQIAMTKRSEDQQGQQVLSLISGAAAVSQNAMQSAVTARPSDTLATEGALGTHINLHV